MLASESLFGQKVQCKGCGDDIFCKSRVLVRCVDCAETGGDTSKHLDLCPECYAGRVEIGSHEAHHNYQLVDDGGFVLFPNPPESSSSRHWTAKEHLMLLDSVEMHGLGNWEDVAKSLNSELGISNTNQPNYKSPAAVKDQFTAVFLHGKMGRLWQEDQRGQARDHTMEGPAVVKQEQHCANLTSHESILLGYLPIRDDFEVEYNNESEAIISHLQHTGLSPNATTVDEDDLLEQQLKAAHVEIYRAKLKDRESRKKVVRDHMLISQFFRENPITYDSRGHAVVMPPKPKKSSSVSSFKDWTSAEIMEKLKILSRFQSVQEFQAFIANINKEKDIKNRLKDLNRYRKNGIRKVSEVTEFETQVKVRRANRKKSDRRRTLLSCSPSLEGKPMSNQPSPMVASPVSILSESEFCAQSPIRSLSSPTPTVFSISGCPGYDILSTNEKKLCTNLRLTPAHYISYKTCLLTNHLQKKKGLTPKPLNPVGLDKNNRKVIFNFLMRAGWITAY